MIADKQQMMSQSLYMVLSKEEDMEVIATVKNGLDAVDKCIELIPDIVFLDVELSGLSGVVATALIRKHYPQVKIIILTEIQDWRTILEVLKNGADAYVLKTTTPEELIKLVRHLYQDKM